MQLTEERSCMLERGVYPLGEFAWLTPQYGSTPREPGAFHKSLKADNMITPAGLDSNADVMAAMAEFWFVTEGTATPLFPPCQGHPVSVMTTGWLESAKTAWS
jgi:hypothetical protein